AISEPLVTDNYTADPSAHVFDGRIYIYPPDYDALWATITVVASDRRRGIGSALLDALADHARTAGKAYLHIPTSDARPEGAAFLAQRGFGVLDRDKVVRLDLHGVSAPTVGGPAGIIITTLADRPDLVAGVHAVAVEAFADIPTGDEPMAAGDLAEFRARDVDRPKVPHDGFFVALDAVSGAVVGYASLLLLPGSTTIAWHDMTAVVRGWRGRGIAGALKRATIAWAVEHGLAMLETGNDEGNAPMRALNAKLGYRPAPDRVTMRGRITPKRA
ncbi:MAG: GNAT family N-acetyltransferase, partial [Candidatus Limnocylindrales bacterium]